MRYLTTGVDKTRSLQLDLLRGIAILLILGRHVYLKPEDSGVLRPFASIWFHLGWTGVDLFFVLSGFLIGGLLFKEWSLRSSLDVKRFLIRRGSKIWPPYFVYIIFVTVAYIALNHFSATRDILLLMSPNFLHLQSYVLSPTIHTWSLATEEHFYLGLPLLLLLLTMPRQGWRSRARWLGLCGVSLFALLACVNFLLKYWLPAETLPEGMRIFVLPYLNPLFLLFLGGQLFVLAAFVLLASQWTGGEGRARDDGERLKNLPLISLGVMALCLLFRVLSCWVGPNFKLTWAFTFFGTHLRIDSLFFGVLLGYLHHFKRVWLAGIGRRRITLLLTGAALVCSIPVLTTNFHIPGEGALFQLSFTLLYLGYGAILLALVHTDDSGIGGRILNSYPSRILAFIGYYSYSIYLWHINPVRGLIEKEMADRLTPLFSTEVRWVTMLAIYLIASICCGVIMSKLIERPALKLRDRLFPSRADLAVLPAEPVNGLLPAHAHAVQSGVRRHLNRQQSSP